MNEIPKMLNYSFKCSSFNACTGFHSFPHSMKANLHLLLQMGWNICSALPHNEFNNTTRDVHCEEHWAQVNLSLNWLSHHHEMKKTNSYLEDGKKTTKPVHHVLQFQWLIENMQNTSMVV